MGNGCGALVWPPGRARARRRSDPLSTTSDLSPRPDGALLQAHGSNFKAQIYFNHMLLTNRVKESYLVTETEDELGAGIEKELEREGWGVVRGVAFHDLSPPPHLLLIDSRSFTHHRFSSILHSATPKRPLTDPNRLSDPLVAVLVEKGRWRRKSRVKEMARKAGIFHVLSIRPGDLKELRSFLEFVGREIWVRRAGTEASRALFIALDHSPTPVEIIDSNKNVQYVNAAYEKLTGCLRDDILGSLSSDLRRKSLPAPPPAKNQGGREETPTKWEKIAVHDSETRPVRPSEQQFLYIRTKKKEYPRHPPSKQCSTDFESRRVSGADDVFHKTTNNGPLNLGAPVSKVLGLLTGAYQHSSHEPDIQSLLQEAIEILRSSELYAPSRNRINEDDKVAVDLFDGLLRNGPMGTRSRKMSLSETMKSSTRSHLASSVLNCASPEIRNVLMDDRRWSFDVFLLERLTFRRPLVQVGMKILERWKVREFLGCSESCLRAWLETMELHYQAHVSYHNSTHAADVLQATAYFLEKDTVANIIEHADGVAALISAVIHDLDHPGRGSSFLINTRHPMAVLYNDVSVLENHHVAVAFHLTLNDPRRNIFNRLGRTEYFQLRADVVDLVLATDMKRHFEYLARFQQSVLINEHSGSGEGGFPSLSEGEIDPKQAVCRLLVKCADISNPTRPWELCQEWAFRILDEYFRQTAEERAKGLPLTMEVFDRASCNVPLTQSRFIDMFARDMFLTWSRFCGCPELVSNLERNYLEWQKMAERWEEEGEGVMERIARAGPAPTRPSLDSLLLPLSHTEVYCDPLS